MQFPSPPSLGAQDVCPRDTEEKEMNLNGVTQGVPLLSLPSHLVRVLQKVQWPWEGGLGYMLTLVVLMQNSLWERGQSCPDTPLPGCLVC